MSRKVKISSRPFRHQTSHTSEMPRPLHIVRLHTLIILGRETREFPPVWRRSPHYIFKSAWGEPTRSQILCGLGVLCPKYLLRGRRQGYYGAARPSAVAAQHKATPSAGLGSPFGSLLSWGQERRASSSTPQCRSLEQRLANELRAHLCRVHDPSSGASGSHAPP